MIYIHYGCTEFNPDKFNLVKNRKSRTKPTGGFWASKVNSIYGWREWCQDEEYKSPSLNKWFKFNIKEGSNILTINSITDIEGLPHTEPIYGQRHCLDFEKLFRSGVDAIDVTVDSDEIYFGLYGWDCDSILIMNKDIILPL